jgi:hypothetical protein
MATIRLAPGDDFARALDQLPSASELLLPRGAIFETTRTPTVKQNDVRIATYGDAALPAPVVRGRGCGGLACTGNRGLVVSGVRFAGVGTPVARGVGLMNVHDVTLEELDVSGFVFGVTVEGMNRGDSADVTVRRCRIHDNYHPQRAHSAGLYSQCTDRLTLEHNLFDTNGWQPPERKTPVAATDQNHNAYLQSTNGPAIVRGNVFANASSHGIQQRCGGICEGNVFVDNPIHQSYGLINGAPGFPGGVSGVIRNNVYVGSRDINGSPRGWAIELANVLKVEVSDVIVAHDRYGNAIAVQVNVPQRVTNPQELVGVLDLTIAASVYVWDWPRGPFWKNASIVPDGAGMLKLGRFVCLSKWTPPAKADLTKIVSLGVVRELMKSVPTADTAAGLIRACQIACQIACGIDAPPPAVPPAPAIKLALWREGVVLSDDLRDGDRIELPSGVVATLVPASPGLGVRFSVDGKLIREERNPPLSLGGDAGPGKINPFEFPRGAFVLTAEAVDGSGVVVARRDVSLLGGPPEPDVPDVPDVRGARAAAQMARGMLPADPTSALVQVDRVIDLLS